MCTGKRQTHIRNAPSSRTAVTGIGPYNQTGKCLRIRPKFSVSQMHSVGRTESSAPAASRVSASSVPHRFICHRTIVAATAAFKDSQRGDMGMMIFCSAAANSSGQIPCPSLPITTAALHKSACRRLQTIQSHAHARKYAPHACMMAHISVHVYGEKPYMSKRKASQRRFCECGSE